MKFGRELASQMVQEWQTAYMDYQGLKTLLKNHIAFRKNTALSPPPPEVSRSRSLKRRLTMYRAFSGLNNLRGSPKKADDEVILVSSVQQEGSDQSYYQTMFLRSSEEGGQIELEFFRKLDHEFNKVVKFYSEKVEQVKVEAEELTKQMDALIALKIIVDKPPTVAAQFVGAAAPATVVASVNGVKQGGLQLDAIQEVEMSSEGGDGDGEVRAKRNRAFRPASLEVLDHVKINVEPDTPVSTLRTMVGSSKSDLSFSKDELTKAEVQLRQALTEFYQQLRLLKSYCFMNVLAFSKIMKKYDKITSRSASKAYLEMVDNSYLGTSDEVNKLIERIEATFIKYFANGNRRKGMKSLKPGHKREKHRTTFFLGLFTGCSIALVVAIMVSLHGRALLEQEERTKYMQSIFPLYSLFGFIVLHMLMYGADTFFWRRYRVNYPFIFGFKPGTELGFREVLLLASGLSVLSLAAVLSNLDMEMEPNTKEYSTLTELVPLTLVSAVFVITICPFNIIYRSSRYFLIHSAWHCVCAPLYKITLPDFFLADQLTSQVQAFRCLLFYAYYYFSGDFTTRTNNFLKDSNSYDILYIVVAIIPFWSRLIQSLRRLIEEKDRSQGANAFKYFSTIVALVMRTIFSQKQKQKPKPPSLVFWRIMASSTSGFTTIFNTYWDIVIDWGLVQRNSRNPWLRDKLLISNKAVYFVAIVVNILLRLVWMQLVLDFQIPFLHEKGMVALIACLEILRRGIWNFFRVENEHFNNVGKYRAFKTVPLPFHYEDEKIM
ncbi:phosphate transporter PHO1 homolog 9-like isoform X1 [Salvia splendens]|uniref:phosphate transporter PHO1 homolog 9-like isoform X1 n=1 Tax=Salvia splendens TaxID=180675 RepID=UPI001C2648A9|nr:phosphate transporter PHO1 homolog 9-like isoform X1 [Salvia splendens]